MIFARVRSSLSTLPLLGLICVAASGCVGWAQVRHENEAALRQRASFDLNCPPAELALVPLNYPEDVPSQYGVRGCTREATYVNISRGIDVEWVLNSDNRARQQAP